MDNNYKFTFVAGAPGSAWSMISFRMKITVPGYDKSDQTAERQYDLPEAHAKNNYDVKDRSTWKAKTHIGSYYGPYHGLGDQFDDLTYYNGNVEGFYDECLRPFNDTTKPRKLVKSHWFAYNLDWLWENCKGHDLMLVWRETDAADKWWHTMGGWDIKHPVYDWYVDDERMHKQIAIESDNIWEFGERKGVKWLDYDVNDSWIQKRFGVPFLKKVQATPKFEDTIKIGYITIT